MKNLAALILCLAIGISSYAQGARDLIVGVWKVEWSVATGTIVGYTEFTKDGRCLQVARMKEGGGRWMFVESKWGLEPTMWQEVVRSNNPSLTAGRRSEVRLSDVSATQLIYEKEGQRISEERAAMPDDARRRLNAFLKDKKG
jgi:hypothetical protein